MRHKKLWALSLAASFLLSSLTACSSGYSAVSVSSSVKSNISAEVGKGAAAVSYRDCPEAYEQTMEYHNGFTILQLTDLHWSTCSEIGDKDYGCIGYLDKVIREAISHAGSIDLIEITGDTFMLADSRAVDKFIDYMTELAIPYAMVWGNHDRESTYGPNYLSNRFLTAPYSLYTEVDNDDVNNRSNYVINLSSDGKTVWQLIELDSGASYRNTATEFNLTYDYFRSNQTEWLHFMHERAGSDVPAICYYHVAQLEHQLYWDRIQAGDTSIKNKFFKCEGFAASAYAIDTTDLFAENNVKGVFLGHDHANDWTFTTEQGVTYGLGVKTGKELYSARVSTNYENSGVDFDEDFDLIGASLVTLTDTSGSFRLEHLYLNERDEGDFVMWVEY